MRNYEIVFCFLDKDGYVESDDKGEMFYIRNVKATSEVEALRVLREEENFYVEPEIISIKSDYDKVFDLCKKIGLKTTGDLKTFTEAQKAKNESVLEALVKYAKALGDDFKIMEDLEK